MLHPHGFSCLFLLGLPPLLLCHCFKLVTSVETWRTPVNMVCLMPTDLSTLHIEHCDHTGDLGCRGMPRNQALVSMDFGNSAARLQMVMPSAVASWITASYVAPVMLQAQARQPTWSLHHSEAYHADC